MKSHDIRSRFLTFFEKRGHAIIPSASLVPENDPTVLFNTAGMQPLVPYLMGGKHPAGTRLADSQKCVRTGDIDDIGDNTHCTFFEMLGNWSLGDYFKEDAIKWSYEFLTSKTEGLGLDPQRLYVTVFEGDEQAGVPRDTEAFEIWKKVGMPEHRIYFKGADSNWWPAVKKGPNGEVRDGWTGPTGPCSEMFYDVTEKGLGDLTIDQYNAADEKQQVVEIWNDVFMEFEKKEGKIIGKLAQKNVDTGAGLERLCMVLQRLADPKVQSVFDTDLFDTIMGKINEFSVAGSGAVSETPASIRAKRIVADHIRTATFLIGDGVLPSNTDQGYILRRLLRRAVRFADVLGMKPGSLFWLSGAVIEKFGPVYGNLIEKAEHIKKEVDAEEGKFRKTLQAGMKEFDKVSAKGRILGKEAFILFSTYGFPVEVTAELAKDRRIDFDQAGFVEEMFLHQNTSRAGAAQKFKGGLADADEMSVKYHTATHLLHQALRDVLGTHVQQKGSNITAERLRFDFAHTAKMTDDEKKRVEMIVNEKIAAALPMQVLELPKSEAEQLGALHFFGDKYGDKVTVYFIGGEGSGVDAVKTAYSKEFCGGPHVKNTKELAGPAGAWKFKIAKEEAVSAGVRRIKAVLA